MDGAARLLADHPVKAYLTAREQERPPPRHVATYGVFGPPSAVVCVADFPPGIEQHGAAVDVLATGKKITFASRAAPALRLLMTGHPVELAEVTAATGVDAVVLAEALIKEGVCAELTEALSRAAFRLAYELPPVARVAVGTSNPAHLRELVAATELVVNDDAIGRYRQLIRTPVGTTAES